MNFNVVAGIGMGILFYNLTDFRFIAISISEFLQLLNFAAFVAGSGEIDFQNKNLFLETWLIAIRNGDVLYGFTSMPTGMDLINTAYGKRQFFNKDDLFYFGLSILSFLWAAKHLKK